MLKLFNIDNYDLWDLYKKGHYTLNSSLFIHFGWNHSKEREREREREGRLERDRGRIGQFWLKAWGLEVELKELARIWVFEAPRWVNSWILACNLGNSMLNDDKEHELFWLRWNRVGFDELEVNVLMHVGNCHEFVCLSLKYMIHCNKPAGDLATARTRLS